MSRRWAGKVVVVTGASAGVGRAIARAFGAEGAKVALLARSVEPLDHAAQEIRNAGGDAMVLPVDVASAAEVDAAADAVAERWGHIDVWVNDAMVSVFSPVTEMRADEFRRVTEVNYLGFVHGTLAALRHMRPRDAGTIVQIGSALAYRSIPLQSAYCATKSAIRAFTESLRCELIHDRSRVRVTQVHLPAVNTPQFDVVRNRLGKHAQPVPPIFQPELIADVVLRAARRAPREVWLGWPTTKAILGQRVIPGLLDHYLARYGYTSQVTDALPPTHLDDVDEPLPGDRGAHGDFDARSRSHDVFSALQLRGPMLPIAALSAAALAFVALRR